jgi:hypothetical protein
LSLRRRKTKYWLLNYLFITHKKYSNYAGGEYFKNEKSLKKEMNQWKKKPEESNSLNLPDYFLEFRIGIDMIMTATRRTWNCDKTYSR